jgi:hypothetical protein
MTALEERLRVSVPGREQCPREDVLPDTPCKGNNVFD